MELSITKRINATTNLTIRLDDEKDMKEAFLKLTPFMQISGKCGKCGKENVALQARKTKDKEGDEFIYLELRCRDCRATQNFGEYKQPKGALFLKEWVEYVPKDKKLAETPKETHEEEPPFGEPPF